MYRLIYPDGDVSLADVARAALKECGREGVTVVAGAGSQVIRVPEECADAVMEAAGLLVEPEPAPQKEPASEPEKDTAPGSDAPTSDDTDTPKKTTGRPAGRAAGDISALKKSNPSTRRSTRRKEG